MLTAGSSNGLLYLIDCATAKIQSITGKALDVLTPLACGNSRIQAICHYKKNAHLTLISSEDTLVIYDLHN